MSAAGVLDAEDVDEFPGLDSIEPETPKRRTRQPRDPSATPRTRTTSDAKLAQELLEPMAMLGQAVSFMSPTGGAVIIARGEVTTTALVKFAKGHPRMLAALRNVSKVSPVAELIQTLAMVLIAVQVDLGTLESTAPMAQLTGVSAIHAEMMEYMTPVEEGVVDFSGVGGQFDNVQPPPEFVGESYNEDGTWSAPGSFRAGPSAGVRNP